MYHGIWNLGKHTEISENFKTNFSFFKTKLTQLQLFIFSIFQKAAT